MPAVIAIFTGAREKGVLEKTFQKHFSGIREGDPLSPPEGEAPQGVISPDPHFEQFSLKKSSLSLMLHKGEGRRDPGRPWLYRNRIQKGGEDLL